MQPKSLSNIDKNAFCDCDSLPKEIKKNFRNEMKPLLKKTICRFEKGRCVTEEMYL